VLTKPGILLRAEGAVILIASFAAYHELGGSWLYYFLLFLWPDLFMLGYLANTRLGAALYNLAVFEHWHTTLLFTLIWTAHIGLDRMLGYWLKYPTAFKDTHFQHV
jgi:hypothetical protein